jgi:hypothetical protein
MSQSTYAIPSKMEDLTTFANDFTSGLATYGDIAGVVLNTGANIQKDLDRATKLDAEYEGIRGNAKGVYLELRRANAAAKRFITQAKKPISFHLGEDWSEKWGMAGFGDGTTAIPLSVPARIQLLKDLAKYFADHPGHQIKDFGVTAAAARQHHATLLGAAKAVEDQKAGQKAARASRDKAISTLRKRLRSTISELDLNDVGNEVWSSMKLTPPAKRNARRPSRTTADAPVKGKVTELSAASTGGNAGQAAA